MGRKAPDSGDVWVGGLLGRHPGLSLRRKRVDLQEMDSGDGEETEWRVHRSDTQESSTFFT